MARGGGGAGQASAGGAGLTRGSAPHPREVASSVLKGRGRGRAGWARAGDQGRSSGLGDSRLRWTSDTRPGGGGLA